MPAYLPIDRPMQRAVMLHLERAYGLTRQRIATFLGVDRATVSNWHNVRAALPFDAVMHLAKWLGPSVLQDAAAACGFRVELDDVDAGSVEREVSDTRRRMGGLTARLAEAQDPDSEGGHTVTAEEALALLPEVRASIEEHQQLERALVALAKPLRAVR